MSMEQDTKDFIELHFKRLEEKIDGFNDAIGKDIIHLQHNDEEHYNLDRTHRAECSSNRDALKKDVDDTLTRFGKRIGDVETASAASDAKQSGIYSNYENQIEELKKSLSEKKNNTQDWLKTLFPYIMILAYLIIDKMGVL